MAKKKPKKPKTLFNLVLSWTLNGSPASLHLRAFRRIPGNTGEPNENIEKEELPGDTTQYAIQLGPGYYGFALRARGEGEVRQKDRLRVDLSADGKVKVLPPKEREGDMVSGLTVEVEPVE